MIQNKIYKYIGIASITLLMYACAIPALVNKTENTSAPDAFYSATDTTNIAKKSWKIFFTDPYLIALIDSALVNNQELNIILQEMNMSNNEIQARKGEYLPFLNIGAGGGIDKVGRYTSQGANDANTDIAPGKETPEVLPDMMIGAFASWEIDIWRKLRNSKDAAISRYLSSIEGKNFMVTNLVSEIADSYYDLLELDNKLSIIQEYIALQSNALSTVQIQKQAGEVTELAVQKFRAEVLSTRALEFDIRQQITEAENRINFMLGRYPQPILRDAQTFNKDLPDTLHVGIPSQLLANRPDIMSAEYQLAAAKLDVKVAKARFYPSVSINAGVGLQAFNAAFFMQSPESIIYSLAGDLVAPVLNRKAIKAEYLNANARQIQAIYDYERSILNAFIEVANQVSKINNLEKSYDLKAEEVKVLNKSTSIASDLFKSAKADYMEVLLTQRDALDARLELIEYKKSQLTTMVHLYRALGGGWQ